jgi:hypothetical protein
VACRRGGAAFPQGLSVAARAAGLSAEAAADTRIEAVRCVINVTKALVALFWKSPWASLTPRPWSPVKIRVAIPAADPPDNAI